MSRAKKPARADSAEGRRQLLLASKTALQPTEELSERAQIYFNNYASTRPSYDWNRADLTRLTKLAQRMYEVDLITIMLTDDGLTVLNQRGTQVANPLIAVRDTLERTCCAMERSLSVYSPMEGSKKALVSSQAKEMNQLTNDKDDLLA